MRQCHRLQSLKRIRTEIFPRRQTRFDGIQMPHITDKRTMRGSIREGVVAIPEYAPGRQPTQPGQDAQER